jgi:hypothetical protein
LILDEINKQITATKEMTHKYLHNSLKQKLGPQQIQKQYLQRITEKGKAMLTHRKKDTEKKRANLFSINEDKLYNSSLRRDD